MRSYPIAVAVAPSSAGIIVLCPRPSSMNWFCCFPSLVHGGPAAGGVRGLASRSARHCRRVRGATVHGLVSSLLRAARDVAGTAGTGEDPGARLPVDPVGAGDLWARSGHAELCDFVRFEHAALHDDAPLRTVGGASGAAGGGRLVLDHSDDLRRGPEPLDGPGPADDQVD